MKSQSKELHVNLYCDEDHLKVFPDVPSTGFKKNKTHFVWAVLPDTNEEGRCEPCRGKRPPCQLCSYMKNANTFIGK